MQSEAHFATSYGEQAVGISQEQNPQAVINSIPSGSKTNPREAKFDIVSAAIIVGGTAQFITFLFGLVTEFVTHVLDNVLLSVFIGLCVGVIAYALMKGND
ncbi:MAG: hypothetical protein M3X11_04620 [Acidobacteriota bacterium]|nr:hypothetical protein [Acidobacteriota bacterium]